MDNDVKYLSLKMNTEYTTPNLVLEKQRIINSLQKNNHRILITLVILILIFTFLFYRNYKKQKTYKKRFEKFIQSNSFNDKESKSLPQKKHHKISVISKEIANDILLKLDDFENKQGFVKKNITVISLAKQLDTNSKYLSKVINNYKNKSFTNYINELRVLYAVESLKSTPKLRKYTIKAISSEFGFNSTEAFSKSFYKITNLYPSYFIKQLGEKEFE
jgi:AraC-like DNA-binding protein